MMAQQTNFNILIIDDNVSIQSDFIKILTKSPSDSKELSSLENKLFDTEETVEYKLPPFKIDTATQGQEGVEFIKKAKQEGRPYALAFVDVRMPPGWDGIETIKHIWEIDPDMQIVICTAYSDYSWEQTVEQLGQRDNLLILKKPFDSITVSQLSCALTQKWHLMQEYRDYTKTLESRVEERTSSLEESLSVTRGTLESSGEGVLVTDNKNAVIEYNQNVIDMWFINPIILEKKDIHLYLEFISAQMVDSEKFLDSVNKGFQNLEPVRLDKLKTKDDRVFEYFSKPYKRNNEIVGRILIFREVTKRAKLEEELLHQATHDLLTGLPNRAFLLDRISQHMLQSNRDSTGFGILYFDLDRFKLINDSLGHSVGDKLLQAVAKRVQFSIRTVDTLSRLGGDEFVIVIASMADKNAIHVVASKLLSSFHEPFEIDGNKLLVAPSVGISIFPQDGKTTEELISNADTAMYRAKELGGNNIMFYTAKLNEEMLVRLELETELHHAIENGEFVLHYQPQLDLASKKLVSVEALIRWQHPTKGILLPMDFIPLAEETGLMLTIGEWVIKTACLQNKKWQDIGLPFIRVSVNISLLQFKDPSLPKKIENILTEVGLNAEYLELELTENVITANSEAAKTLMKLKEKGVKISLDNFGSSYLNLKYLKDISIDRVKIDQSFVKNIETNRADEVIVEAIVLMAKNLNLEVSAEGVETHDQLKFLMEKNRGKDNEFYFSKPFSSAELEIFLKKQNSDLM